MRKLVMAGDSVTGNKYRANFDRVRTDAVRRLAVVADGMGDGRGSETAGRTAVEVFLDWLPADPDPASLRAAVAEVQRRVIAAGHELRELTGCTLTALVAGPADAWIVQLGDSRVYRLRGGVLELLTTDHTIAWLGAVHGWFPFDSPEAHAARYRLTRYVGRPDAPEPDLLNVSLRPDDVYLLCTDGLAEQVPYDRMAQVLGGPGEPGAKVAALLADSLAAGGNDNATAVVIDVVQVTADGSGLPPSSLDVAVLAGAVGGHLFEDGPQCGDLVDEGQDGVRVGSRDDGWRTGKLVADSGQQLGGLLPVTRLRHVRPAFVVAAPRS